MGVAVENCIRAHFHHGTAEFTQPRRGVGIHFMAAVKRDDDQIAFGFFSFDIQCDLQRVDAVGTGDVTISDAELIFGGVDDGNFKSILFDAERTGGIGGIHSGTDGTDVEFLKGIKSIFYSRRAVVAGVIVGKQNGVDTQSCGKDGTFGVAAVVGTAFVDGGILFGDGAFPLQKFQIGIVKEWFDLTGDLIDTFDKIGAILFPGAEISGDDRAELLIPSVAPTDITGIHPIISFIIQMRFAYTHLIYITAAAVTSFLCRFFSKTLDGRAVLSYIFSKSKIF